MDSAAGADAPSTANSTSGTPEARHWRRMERLWEVMTECYGTRWTTSYDVEPTPLWCRALEPLADEAIARGIEGVRFSGGVWPPSLPEFVRLCSVDRTDGGAVAATIPAQRQLPLTDAERARRREAARLAVEEWRGILGVHR